MAAACAAAIEIAYDPTTGCHQLAIAEQAEVACIGELVFGEMNHLGDGVTSQHRKPKGVGVGSADGSHHVGGIATDVHLPMRERGRFDAGGDKPIPGLTHEQESNPFLGIRGVRLSLQRPEVFMVQLRALARAAVHGNLKIMIPMVTTPEELAAMAVFMCSPAAGNLRGTAGNDAVTMTGAQLDAVIINAAGCGSTLKEYGHLLDGEPEAAAFSAKVKDLSEFLVAAGLHHSAFRPPPSAFKVTFHDACHLAHAQRITHPPRLLVKAVAGANYVEMPESDVCCGSAGSYNLTEPEMAERLQRRKVENILKTGATCVVTTNPGCLLQMRAGLDKAGAGHIETLHLADFLARSLA